MPSAAEGGGRRPASRGARQAVILDTRTTGADRRRENDRGEPASGARHRAATLYPVGPAWDPDHEAAMRFGGEAPGRRAHSHLGMEAMQLRGSPPPRTVVGALPQERGRTPEPYVSAPSRRSGRRPQHHAVRDLAGGDHVPQGDEQLSGEGDDHGRLARALGGPRAIPLRQRALLLEPEEAPGELDQGICQEFCVGPR